MNYKLYREANFPFINCQRDLLSRYLMSLYLCAMLRTLVCKTMVINIYYLIINISGIPLPLHLPHLLVEDLPLN